ncbi:large ribosomal subunit protein bL31c-like [Henckelia pumila]|uniref:large ribosomal subunit protein bL31c-like n=1 Tax=Henckelia pumila TaxID=405737 RepID=UPI003C6E0805
MDALLIQMRTGIISSKPGIMLAGSGQFSSIIQGKGMTCGVAVGKKDIHLQFQEHSKVYCNGELVMTTGGTKKEYVVDVWSGNHLFYLGSRAQLLIDADQVKKFRKKFSGLSQIMEIPVLKGEIILPPKNKSGKGKRKYPP